MKRIFDLLISIVAMIVLSPVFLVLILLIYFKLGKPVFFVQERPGLDGKPFKMFKFRSMTNEVDKKGNFLPNEQRLTKFGRLLRASSLDELPELLNVLKGDMSLVGPRPLLMEYLPLYSSREKRRHEVRPGITGWAQVNGRNAISWEQKFEHDIWYVDNYSVWLDIKILLVTIKKVCIHEGVNNTEQVTMPKFKGSSLKEAQYKARNDDQ